MDDRAVFEESLKRVKHASVRHPKLGRMLERLETQNNGASQMELFSHLCDSMLECMDQPAEGMTVGTMTESALGEASSSYSPGPPPPPASSPIPDVRASQL